MGRLLEVGIAFWGCQSLADLAPSVFGLAIGMLQAFEAAKSREFFDLLRRFATALARPNQHNCFVDPVSWVILALELVVTSVNNFDRFVADAGDENDRLEHIRRLEMELEFDIDEISLLGHFPDAKHQLVAWIRRQCAENFSPGVCYVVSCVDSKIRAIASPLVADQLISAPYCPPICDFIASCSEYRRDLADKWLDILIHSDAPLYRVGPAAENLAFHSPRIFLSDNLAGITWVIGRFHSAVSWEGTVSLLRALLCIACSIGEDNPYLEHVPEVALTA
jgi:hypothetical protein